MRHLLLLLCAALQAAAFAPPPARRLRPSLRRQALMEVWLNLDGAPPRAAAALAGTSGLFDRTIGGTGGLRQDEAGRLFDGTTLVGACASISSTDDQRAALALVGSVDWLVVDARAAQLMIVAENVISIAGPTATRVACAVSKPDDVPGLAFALETGVDALVVMASDVAEASAMVEALQIAKAQRGEVHAATAAAAAGAAEAAVLSAAAVTAVEDGGVADRVAVDLTTLLADDEGCLVGSSAKALALVLGETLASAYVPPQPFRVNAGPVHSYVMLADGTTKYLSEVAAGDIVLVCSASGETRPGTVGRAKVEPRPALRVEFADGDGRRGNVFLQQAETVRLATGADGGYRSVTDAKVGDPVLVRFSESGTHVGRAVAGSVEER